LGFVHLVAAGSDRELDQFGLGGPVEEHGSELGRELDRLGLGGVVEEEGFGLDQVLEQVLDWELGGSELLAMLGVEFGLLCRDLDHLLMAMGNLGGLGVGIDMLNILVGRRAFHDHGRE
jgi:hypothetical protein